MMPFAGRRVFMRDANCPEPYTQGFASVLSGAGGDGGLNTYLNFMLDCKNLFYYYF